MLLSLSVSNANYGMAVEKYTSKLEGNPVELYIGYAETQTGFSVRLLMDGNPVSIDKLNNGLKLKEELVYSWSPKHPDKTIRTLNKFTNLVWESAEPEERKMAVLKRPVTKSRWS